MPSNLACERVLVVPTELFHQVGYFQGFHDDAAPYLQAFADRRKTSFRPRDEVEDDPSYKQLIPYVIFRHVDGDAVSLFQYTRGAGQGEGRLHRLRSIGVGGHISADDADARDDPYQTGLARELEEEVVIDTPYRGRCVGMINDDETPVGTVHLGLVHLFDVERPAVAPRESDLVDAGFRPLRGLLDQLDGFETWSQICLRSLFA